MFSESLVSVPLRGCGFKILALRDRIHTDASVSVPLRGCGFKMIKMYDNHYESLFPSPCGDVVLK